MKKVVLNKNPQEIKLNEIDIECDYILYKRRNGIYYTIINDRDYCEFYELILIAFEMGEKFDNWEDVTKMIANQMINGNIAWIYTFSSFEEMINFLYKEINKE